MAPVSKLEWWDWERLPLRVTGVRSVALAPPDGSVSLTAKAHKVIGSSCHSQGKQTVVNTRVHRSFQQMGKLLTLYRSSHN